MTERARRATCRWPVLLLTWLCAGHGAAAEPWSAEKFQVVAREPTEDEIALVAEEPGMLERFFSGPGGPGGLDVHGPQPPGTGTIVGWLNDAGGAYRRSSHAPPALGPIVESGAGRRYRVYVFPFAGSRTRDTHAYAAGTYESNTCMENNKIPWLAINHDLAAAAPPRQMFWTITHEMMHAIMFGDRVLDDCNSNPFEVSEGIPDGASLYLVNHKFSGFSGGIAYKSSHVGLRSYRLPFFFFTDVPSSQKTWLELVTGYATSSFWYFVTERFGGLKVLPHFLDKPVREGADHVDMYRWLEERLQSLPGIQSIVPASPDRPVTGTGAKEPPGMYEVYPAFISEFASYGGSRYFKFNDRHFRGVEQARTGWLKRSLGGCEEVTLNPQNKHDKVTLGILENAAKCVRVKYRGFAGNITSKMEILSDRLGQLEQLHLGWAWKIGPEKEENCYLKRKEKNARWPPCVLKAYSQTGPSQGRYARTWPSEMLDFGASGGKDAERIFVLSNVAVDPWKTTVVSNYTVKIAVSTSMGNGQPSEPVDQVPVPRKKSAPQQRPGNIGREELYGLQTDPPVPEAGIKGIAFNQYTPNRNQGARAKPGGYSVVLHQVEYGQTGPVLGIVTRRDPDGPDLVGSNLCAEGAGRPVGRILKSDEDALEIEIEADLCRADPNQLRQCEGGCPVVDHFEGEMSIAFGWRQFAATAPTDIRTRGIERYINTMPDSLAEAMRFGADTAFPEEDPFGTSPAQPGPGSAGPAAGGALPACRCSCEEWAATMQRAESMKQAIDAGAETGTGGLGELMRCQTPCQREYMICQLEADKAEKARQAARNPADCDCSCASLAEADQRGAELRQRFESGDQVSMDELQEAMRCMSVCQEERVSCMMRQ